MRRSPIPWLLSAVVHLLLAGAIAAFAWTFATSGDLVSARRPLPLPTEPDPEPATPVFEVKDRPAQPPGSAAGDPVLGLRGGPTDHLARGIPLPQGVDPSSLAPSGSPLGDRSGGLRLPGGGQPYGSLSGTTFFGSTVWGSKFVYVIDRSGSMCHEHALDMAKRELAASLRLLPSKAQFQVIVYNTTPRLLAADDAGQKLLSATDAHRQVVIQALESIEPSGGTDHWPALKMAIDLGADCVVFLTDGDDLEPSEVDGILAYDRNRARLHVVQFGVGPDLNPDGALHLLARRGGGSFRYVDTNGFRDPAAAARGRP